MNQKLYLLLLLALVTKFVPAQSPGGVSTNLTMWMKSNSGTSTTGSLLDSWTYVNDGTKSFTSSGSERPTLVSNGINYNPYVWLPGAQLMNGPTGASAPIAFLDDDYTLFAVWRTNSVAAFQRVWEQFDVASGGGDGISLCTWNDGNYGDQVEHGPFNHTIIRSYAADIWNISQLNLLDLTAGDLEVIDDRNISTGILTINTDAGGTNGNGLRALGTTVNRIGAKSSGNEHLNGLIAELIVYDAPVSAGTDRNKIFSYLAMKYGITIKTDLISSAGTTVWNSTTNSAYNNSVFGIGRDDGSGSTVTQSNSIETGSGDGTGQSGKANIVLSNASGLGNLEFLQLGNDGGGLTEITGSGDLGGAATGSKRLGREWKVQHTGNVGTVNLGFDLSGITVTGTMTIHFRLMVDEDGNGNFTNGTIRYYTPLTFNSGVLGFVNITLNNGEVFALVTSASGALLPVTWNSFTAKAINDKVQLDWNVSNNASAKEYQIEHSVDGINFNPVGVVLNQTDVHSYRFIYPSLTGGMHYFRIRQVDADGKATYSKIVSVKGPDFIVRLINNPVSCTYADVEISSMRSANANIELRSVSGALITTKQAVINPGTNRIKIPMDKAATGNYILKLEIGDMILNERILKL